MEIQSLLRRNIEHISLECLKIEQLCAIYISRQVGGQVGVRMLDGHGFDETALLRDLRTWWDAEVGADDPFAPPKPPAGTIFDVLPAIDSLGVVAGLLLIETHLPCKVPLRLIRRGGYNSFDDMVADLMPKLRDLVKKHTQKQKETASKEEVA